MRHKRSSNFFMIERFLTWKLKSGNRGLHKERGGGAQMSLLYPIEIHSLFHFQKPMNSDSQWNAVREVRRNFMSRFSG